MFFKEFENKIEMLLMYRIINNHCQNLYERPVPNIYHCHNSVLLEHRLSVESNFLSAAAKTVNWIVIT